MLCFSAKTAVTLGLHEAIVISYMMNELSHAEYGKEPGNSHILDKYTLHEGQYWIKLTLSEFEAAFPFWSGSTIKRVISRLETVGVLESVKKNDHPFDKTKSYQINSDVLDKLNSSAG